MNAGAAQIDITPAIGCELSGFALRVQPSTGISDPLHARALYLTDGEARLLWIHCDLIGFDVQIPTAFRQWARVALGLSPAEVLLSATHTHSGPCTLRLAEAGAYDEGYVAFLLDRFQQASQLAMRDSEPCTITTAEGHLELAVHRRNPASAHTDPRVGFVGFRRPNGTFIAAIVNYAIHPVGLGHQNRLISADIFGPAAEEIRRRLPGSPVSLVTNGACGNLNPPAIGVGPGQIKLWGWGIADAVTDALRQAPSQWPGSLRVAMANCSLPLDYLDREGIDAFAAKLLTAQEYAAWSSQLPRAVDSWRRSLIAALDDSARLDQRNIEIFAVGIGPVVFVGANAELFSHFTDWLRQATGRSVYTVGYANGNWGYLGTRAAYAEGGYEVESAHVFYGGYRFKAGALELLAEKTVALLRRDFAPAGAATESNPLLASGGPPSPDIPPTVPSPAS